MIYTFAVDLHGDQELLERIIRQFMLDTRLVLVGDYVDSYNNTIREQAKTFESVHEEALRGNLDALLGNHELSYLFKDMRCTGYDPILAEVCTPLNALQKSCPDIHPFKNYIYLPDSHLLITHAGLTARLLGNSMIDFASIPTELIYGIGKVRGGLDKFGGIFWCDFRNEFMPINGLKQVFGHTPLKKIENIGDNYNIDCLEHGKKEVLQFNTETNKFKKVDIK